MARIRSVKPELRTSLVVADWPREVRYFFVLLWGYLDDHGRGVDDARLIKADCLPLDDDVTRHMVDEWVDLIAKAGPLCRYEVAGKRYLHAPNWREHQRPSHPTDSRVPPCPFHDSSGAAPESLANSSGATQESLVPEQGAGSREQVIGAGSREQGSRAKPRAANGTRLPDDFAVTDAMAAWCRSDLPGLDWVRETERFRDYWRGVSGSKGVKADWVATWRNWMRRAHDDTTRRGNGTRATQHEPYRDKPTRDYHGDL